ncbi:flagellar type III secretion system pore protein FliP [Rhizobiaceae bacterium]|nr:flagellar type III secretion system pore protein FliP [Rhizobiaceae bacterium]
MKRIFLSALFILPDNAVAQTPDLAALVPNLTGPGGTSADIVQLFGLLTVLALAPGILVVVTSFTRFVIAFSILRMGLGLQTTPANLILISLALFMSFHVMAPVFEDAWENGVEPMRAGTITQEEAFGRIVTPFRGFMLANVRGSDLALFQELRRNDNSAGEELQGPPVASAESEVALTALVPAFMISEIRRGFEIGFLVLLPFLAIDLIVATITMSMGMMMLPPTVVSLPFKILFFILIDGWSLLVGSMMRSFV